jgi:hypothetical protein
LSRRGPGFLGKATKKSCAVKLSPRRERLSLALQIDSGLAMRFQFTPPGAPIFFLSLILAVAAVATPYTHIPLAGHFVGTHRFWVMAAAYAALLAGVVFEGL